MNSVIIDIDFYFTYILNTYHLRIERLAGRSFLISITLEFVEI